MTTPKSPRVSPEDVIAYPRSGQAGREHDTFGRYVRPHGDGRHYITASNGGGMYTAEVSIPPAYSEKVVPNDEVTVLAAMCCPSTTGHVGTVVAVNKKFAIVSIAGINHAARLIMKNQAPKVVPPGTVLPEPLGQYEFERFPAGTPVIVISPPPRPSPSNHKTHGALATATDAFAIAQGWPCAYGVWATGLHNTFSGYQQRVTPISRLPISRQPVRSGGTVRVLSTASRARKKYIGETAVVDKWDDKLQIKVTVGDGTSFWADAWEVVADGQDPMVAASPTVVTIHSPSLRPDERALILDGEDVGAYGDVVSCEDGVIVVRNRTVDYTGTAWVRTNVTYTQANGNKRIADMTDEEAERTLASLYRGLDEHAEKSGMCTEYEGVMEKSLKRKRWEVRNPFMFKSKVRVSFKAPFEVMPGMEVDFVVLDNIQLPGKKSGPSAQTAGAMVRTEGFPAGSTVEVLSYELEVAGNVS